MFPLLLLRHSLLTQLESIYQAEKNLLLFQLIQLKVKAIQLGDALQNTLKLQLKIIQKDGLNILIQPQQMLQEMKEEWNIQELFSADGSQKENNYGA